MKRTNKRDKLIQVGKQVIVQQGFNAASLNEILTTAGVPKGSFYYYFSSKEDFGLAIINYFAESYRQIAHNVELCSAPNFLDKIPATDLQKDWHLFSIAPTPQVLLHIFYRERRQPWIVQLQDA